MVLHLIGQYPVSTMLKVYRTGIIKLMDQNRMGCVCRQQSGQIIISFPSIFFVCLFVCFFFCFVLFLFLFFVWFCFVLFCFEKSVTLNMPLYSFGSLDQQLLCDYHTTKVRQNWIPQPQLGRIVTQNQSSVKLHVRITVRQKCVPFQS